MRYLAVPPGGCRRKGRRHHAARRRAVCRHTVLCRALQRCLLQWLLLPYCPTLRLTIAALYDPPSCVIVLSAAVCRRVVLRLAVRCCVACCHAVYHSSCRCCAIRPFDLRSHSIHYNGCRHKGHHRVMLSAAAAATAASMHTPCDLAVPPCRTNLFAPSLSVLV